MLTADGVQTCEVSGSTQVLTAAGELPQSVLGTRDYGNRTPTAFRISGVGHGHGVGLSQYGSKTLAESGKTYVEILSTYFPGAELVTVGG